ncbi:hypothetical protein TcBrA4_0122840 [Trypanosoma cruzi]|nr:hypothetical protein TcBrA4_0122840 [Trypanosoma cruzi]
MTLRVRCGWRHPWCLCGCVEREPLPAESPLWDISDDKLLLTAHSADRTANLVPDSVRRFIGLVNEYAKTKRLDTYLVDPVRGY